MVPQAFVLAMLVDIPLVYFIFLTLKQKNLTKDLTFLEKSYGEWYKVEKSTQVPMSYEGSVDEKKVKTFLAEYSNNDFILI